MSASWTHQTAQDGSVASAYDAEASDSVSTGTQQQQQTSASLSQSNHTLGQQQVQQAQQTLSQLTPHQQAQLLQQAALHQQALQLAQAAQQPAKYVPPHLRGQPQAAGQAAAGYGVGPVGFPPLGAYGDGYAAPPANGQVDSSYSVVFWCLAIVTLYGRCATFSEVGAANSEYCT